MGLEGGCHPHHDRGCRCEFKAISRRVASCHQGSAGGSAGGIACITIAEVHAFCGYSINVRRLHSTTANTAAVKRNVIPAQVVCKDDNDIGRAVSV